MTNNNKIQRRQFLKSTVAGIGLTILPSGVLSGANAPSNRLNIALIGAYGRGSQHWNSYSDENIVAICDVNEDHLAIAAERFPDAKQYIDWRRCLDQPDLDAIVCCTTDFTHAFVTNWALNRGLHCYTEKPLGISVEEVRTLRANYLRNKDKLATQCGTQRHQFPNFARVRELVMDGAIGELTEAYLWTSRQIRKDGYLPAAGDPPAVLHYDLWLGPTPEHPYNPGYFSAGVGMNCLSWNPYWDFGVGQIGDMGSHTGDLCWNGLYNNLPSTDPAWLKPYLPTAIEASGEEFDPDTVPVEMRAIFDLPANDWHSAIRMGFFMGGALPSSPRRSIDVSSISDGAMYRGSKGYIVSDYQTRMLIPYGDDADLSYYKPRSEEELIPPLVNFMGEWIDACKGDDKTKTTCNFKYSCDCIETLLLGLVAYRAGERLEYDGDSGRVTNNAAANDLLSREYRSGWVLDG
ncbi:Gfo/Idh/MocA family protein [Planctomycetota bacterium]